MERGENARFAARLDSFDPRRTPILRTDVLVVGSGIAGCAAALAAAESGSSVLMASKSPFGESNTAWAQGGLAAVVDHQTDSPDLHLDDSLRVGAGLADAGVAREIVAASGDVLSWLLDVGVDFDRAQGGDLELLREGGHSVNRIVHQGDATGAAIQRALEPAVRAHPQVTCRTGAFVRDLLDNDGRCVGAVLLIDGMELAVEASAVIVAAGGAGQLYRETTNPRGACGDGMALCFRLGAHLADLEFVQFHPTTLYIAGASRFLISEVVRGAGAVLRDRHGVRFMPDVHDHAELAPRDVVSRAILDRMVATDDTHVYLDLSAIGAAAHERFPNISRICRSFDIDIATDPVPVRPGAHYFIGGVACSADGQTNVPGLLVAGEVAATGFHGANRLASNSLLEAAVLGRRAGLTAAGLAREEAPGLPRNPATRPRHDNAPRLQIEDMLYSLKSLMWRNVGLKRNAQGLAAAAERITLWNRYLERADLCSESAFQLRNMLAVAALVTSAAGQRLESRGTHFRDDHPERNDQTWCRRIFVRRLGDGTVESTIGPLRSPSDHATS